MNELNKKMKKVAERFCLKNNLVIVNESYGEEFYTALLDDNSELILNKMDGISSIYFDRTIYMKRSINGKQKRIPRNQW